MARIRTIKPGFFKNEDIAGLPSMTRLFFIGLWTQADRAGRLEDRPRRLKAEIFPYDNYDVEKGLNELQSAGFIIRYKANVNVSDRVLAPEQPVTELALIQITNFSKHQQPNVKEVQSTFPAPCQHDASTMPALQEQEQEYGKEQEGSMELSPAQKKDQQELPEDNKFPPPVARAPSLPVGIFPGEKEIDMELPEMKIGIQIQRIRYTKRIDIDSDQVLGMWDVFKREHFKGKKHYADQDDIYSHFGNWLKDQKFSNGQQPASKSNTGNYGQSAGAIKLARSLAADCGYPPTGGTSDPEA
jgi:hypothetical protein